ncbi:MAG: NADH-quinone oxidoreductase subunit J [Anaerolineae bacterium]|nr:MAG: NADH-quinone oxidoreductase subunit J [Anaerolineae bacterium]
MTVEFAIFLGLSLVAVGAAIGMLVSRNAVYSVLFLVIVFLAIAVLFLLLSAAFIAMVQVAVYAGAIMILFLFVIMLLGPEYVESEPSHPWQFATALVLSFALIIQFLIVAIVLPGESGGDIGEVAQGFGSPASIGTLLFKEYLIPFEVASLLLLAAMVGAIVLTRGEHPR